MIFVDAVIVSAWGRGAWLANQLVQLKKKTAFIDLSSHWPNLQEEIEGPFGFFIPEDMDMFQQEWWRSQWIPSEQGFSVLSDDLFLHFKDTFLSSVYAKRKDYSAVRSYLIHQKQPSGSFKETWLIHLIHSIFSSVSAGLNSIVKSSRPLPVFRDFGVVSSPLNSLSLLHPDVIYQQRSVFDYQIKKREDSYLLANNREFFLKAKQIIFMLNPAELSSFHPLLFLTLFRKRIQPSWYWDRFVFDFDFGSYPFPAHFVCVDPSQVPWNGHHLLVCKRDTHFKNRLNVWVKLPCTEKDELRMAQNIQDELKRKFPNFKCSFRSYNSSPKSFLFPVYDSSDLNRIFVASDSNIFNGWDPYDISWNGWAAQEFRILSQISKKDSVL